MEQQKKKTKKRKDEEDIKNPNPSKNFINLSNLEDIFPENPYKN
uniref:Uncharacterized protein n=1 Tax=Oryza sativa subsp. japonica TaxID=39947 RepID=Q339W8_ORYSJ|nr:hypothetical protein LOC_Os10g17759 [Oryza sativa Japonica Group]